MKTAQRTSTSVQAAVLGSNDLLQSERWDLHELFPGAHVRRFRGRRSPIPIIESLFSEGVSRIQVANELLQSNLGRQSLLTCAYNMVLQRDPTQPEIVLYLSQMKNENVLLRQIVVTLLASSEFYVKATTPTAS